MQPHRTIAAFLLSCRRGEALFSTLSLFPLLSSSSTSTSTDLPSSSAQKKRVLHVHAHATQHRLIMSESDDASFSMSQLSLDSSGSQSEDWDRSLSMDGSQPPSPGTKARPLATTTPRNSIIFPVEDEATPGRSGNLQTRQPGEQGKRSLSELLRLHAEKGTDCKFSAEEAARVADVLRDWVSHLRALLSRV
jgi:hypothetical protein